MHVVEPELSEQVLDDPQHGLVVVHDEDRQLSVDGHRPALPQGLALAGRGPCLAARIARKG